MKAKHWACAALAGILAVGLTFSQEERRQREGGTTREGGIPRDAIGGERERDKQDGLEEGTPDIETNARAKEALSRWRMPRGDWKLGVWGYNTENGVVITRVAPDSAAAREGLEQGDRIVGVGGYQVGYVGDLLFPLGFELRRQADSRGQVLLLVQNVRDKELLNLTVQLDRPGRIRPQPLERP